MIWPRARSKRATFPSAGRAGRLSARGDGSFKGGGGVEWEWPCACVSARAAALASRRATCRAL
eukprot:5395451-Pyramimonas_sp.AAC.1